MSRYLIFFLEENHVDRGDVGNNLTSVRLLILPHTTCKQDKKKIYGLNEGL